MADRTAFTTRRAAGPAAGALPPGAAATLVVLMASWGLHIASVKLALPEMAPAVQSLVRAVLSTLCLTVYMRARGERILAADATLLPGLVVGVLFATEFLMIFGALTMTTAARGALLLYTMPFFVTAMAVFFLPEERLGRLQLGGLLAAFLGLAVAFADGFSAGAGAAAYLGDLMMIGAAISWAATIVVIKRSALATAPATRVLWYQLAVSIPVSLAAVLVAGSPIPVSLSGLTIAVVLYQGVWVAFLTYVAWFALVARHPAPVLSAFSFLTPVFGVLFGHLVLGEPVGPRLVLALVLIAAGLILVSRPRG